ncbi:MAG: hypothetical protein QNK69_03680, partial [Amylibacter sp.]
VTAINEIKTQALGIDSNLAVYLRSDVTDTKTAGDLVFSDNVKAAFGDASDLQIYHNPSIGSIIEDTGAGSLFLRGSTTVQIETASGDDMLLARESAEVKIYYNGSEKLATTNTGVDVTGSVTADGLTVANSVASADLVYFNNTNATQSDVLRLNTAGAGIGTNILDVQSDGITKFVVRGDGRVGIGTTSPDYLAEVEGSGGGTAVTLAVTNTESGPARLQLNSGHGNWSVGNSVTVADNLEFRDESANVTRMLIKNTGVDITGILKAPDAYSTTSVSAPNVHIAADGSFARSTFSALGSRVLLSSVTVSTAVTTVDFDNTLITDTYNDYEVDIQNLLATTRAPFSVRVGFANTPSNSAIYNFYFENRLRHQTATTTVAVNSVNHADAQFVPWNATYQLQNSNSDHPQYGTWKFSNVRTSNSWMLMQAEMHGTTAHPNNLYVGWSYGSGAFKSSSPVNYLSFIVGGSTNIRAGTFNLYGIQK